MEPKPSTSRKLLVGRYSSGQFVMVYGQNSQDELKLLGCFGEDLEKAKRKDYNRRGPLDRQLADLIVNTTTEPVTILTLHEAFFLAYALGCLSLQLEEQCYLSSRSYWNLCRDYHTNSNLQLDFAVEYGVYHYFRSRGWIVKSGSNYGTNFLLYKQGPSIDHAQYAVIIMFEDYGTSVSSNRWDSLLTFNRVVQSACKELLLVFVIVPDKSKFTFEEPSCTDRMKLALRTFSSQSSYLNQIYDAK